MTALATSLQGILRTRLPTVALPDIPPEIDRAYRMVKQKLGEGLPMQSLTAQESQYWVTLARTTYSQGSWEDLRPREMKNIGLCLWYGDPSLATDEHFLKAFFKMCENRIKKSLCRALIWVYLHHYEPNKPGIALLGQWLAKMVNGWDWQWADRQRQFSLFSGQKAPHSIASAIIDGKEGITTILESCGLAGTLQSGGMTSAAFREIIRQYRESPGLYDTGEIISRLKRVLEWATLDGKQFSYPKLKTVFIESLLLPWAGASPEEKIINLTQSSLLDHFGDPRLGGASWIGVDESAMRVIRGWLVKRALAQFLDVVDELALDYQWKYRRAFWMAYYKKGLISDAWVVFATKGASKAKEIARRHDDNSWLSFGKLQGYRDPYHAVLILRIGDLTIADFSHNGKWRIWNRANDKAPQPYNTQYNCDDLMNGGANYEGSHIVSDRYKWQREVADVIARTTGKNLVSQKDYNA